MASFELAPPSLEDVTRLRQLLLKVLRPDVQYEFHHVVASRTPDEWAQRECLLAEALAAHVEAAPRAVGGSPKELYCPLCREGIPNAGFESDAVRKLVHHLGDTADACAVKGELRRWLDAEANARFDVAALGKARLQFKQKQVSSSRVSREPRITRRGAKPPSE